MDDLWDLPYPTIVVVGLVMAILLRRRLGAAAGPAIIGFAILAVCYAAGLSWGFLLKEWFRTRGQEQFGGGLPAVTDYPPGLVAAALGLAIANAAGLALLIRSVLRGRSGPPPSGGAALD